MKFPLRSVSFMATLIAVVLLLLAWWPAAAQDAPPAPPAATPAPTARPDYTQAYARRIALSRVPGTFVSMDYDKDGNPATVNILDSKGRECVVFVSEQTRSVTRVVVPRMTKKAAIAVALKKVRGKVSVGRNQTAFYDAAKAAYVIYVEPTKPAARRIVTVGDKTGKVVSVTEEGEVG